MAKLTEELQFIIDLDLNDADVKKVIRSVDNVVRKTQQLVTTTKLSEEAQEEANQIFLAADKIYSKFNQTLDKSTKEYGSVVSKQNTLIRGSQQLALQQKGLGKATNNANQILFSFGDAIQDGAQFQFGFAQGARAIGNNLAFAAEQFALTNQRAGGFLSTLKILGKSFLGPAGIILAINAAITAITLYGDKIQKFLNINKDLEASLGTITDAVKDQVKELQKAGIIRGGEIEQAKTIISFAEERIKLLEEEIKKTDERRNSEETALRSAIFANAEVRKSQSALFKELGELNEERENEIEILQDLIRTSNQEIVNLKEKKRVVDLVNDSLRETILLNIQNREEIGRAQVGVDPILSVSGFDPDTFLKEFLTLDRVDSVLPVGSLAFDLDILKQLNQEFQNAVTDAERQAVAERIALKQQEVDAKQELIKKDAQNNKIVYTRIAGFANNLFSSLNQLNQAQSDESEKQARKRFETAKKLALAQAIVNTAAAFADTLREEKGEAVKKIIAASLIGAAGAVQIKAIRKTTFEGGGSNGASGGARASFPSSASSSRTESTFEAARTPSAFRQQPNFNVNFDTNFSAKGMAQTVRIGEQEIMNNTVTG